MHFNILKMQREKKRRGWVEVGFGVGVVVGWGWVGHRVVVEG